MIGPSQGDCLGFSECHLLWGLLGSNSVSGWGLAGKVSVGVPGKCYQGNWTSCLCLPFRFQSGSCWNYKIKRTMVVIMKKENKSTGKTIKQSVVVVEPDSRIFGRILSSYVVWTLLLFLFFSKQALPMQFKLALNLLPCLAYCEPFSIRKILIIKSNSKYIITEGLPMECMSGCSWKKISQE